MYPIWLFRLSSAAPFCIQCAHWLQRNYSSGESPCESMSSKRCYCRRSGNDTVCEVGVEYERRKHKSRASSLGSEPCRTYQMLQQQTEHCRISIIPHTVLKRKEKKTKQNKVIPVHHVLQRVPFMCHSLSIRGQSVHPHLPQQA